MAKKGKKLKTYDANTVNQLAESIVYHKSKYYAGFPEISDVVYDALEDSLKDIAPNHPVLNMVGGGAEPKGSSKVVHKKPMLSLAKTYKVEDLVSWMKDHEVVGTMKLDGNSLSLVYEDGKLVLSKTRGKGRQGENVTDKTQWVADCVPALRESKNLEVRGELYCTESQFIKLCQDMKSKDLEPPTNPRNTVAGILGRKQYTSLARYFNFAAFDVLDEDGFAPFDTEVEKFAWLRENGFQLPVHEKIHDEKGLNLFLDRGKQFMEEDEVGIDGVVFTYNQISLHQELGETSHHPRYKMSFKWQGETAEATIDDFVWATSRLGIVTPVAVIQPVQLSGATITNVTLHNAAHVRLFDLKIGDVIEIVRSGEVIPKFLNVIKKAEGECVCPEHCPSCESPLEFDGVRLICRNQEHCPAQQIGTILNWIKAVSIDDLSEKRLQTILDLGLIEHMAELYELTIEDFLTLPLTKEKMAKKLYENIQNSKSLPLAQFLNGLGIQGMGLTMWETLLNEYPTLEQVRNAKWDDIVIIDGFAEKSSVQVVDGLSRKSKDIDKLLHAGVKPIDHVQVGQGSDSEIAGKTIVITGTLTRPRSDFEAAIKQAGGKLGKSVSSKTDALVIADPNSTSSKAKKARDLGVSLWSEEEFWQQIN